MNGALSIMGCLLSDSGVFLTFELLYLILFVYAFIQKRKSAKREGEGKTSAKKGIEGTLTVTRGSESWQKLSIAFGVASLVIIQLVSISGFGKGYKVIISIADLSFLIYLVFYNAWFRNKLIGLIGKSTGMEEK